MTSGQWLADLETLRQRVAERAPLARFGEPTPSGLRIAEYRFRLMVGTSVYVQSPTTPTGRQRAGLGLWRYCLHGQPWCLANGVDTVVEFIRQQSERAR